MEERFLGRKDITTDVRRLQAMMGTLYAGGGIVKLGTDGIEIIASTTFADSRSYKFIDASGDIVARCGAVHDDTVDDYRSVDIRTLPHAGLGSIAWVVSESPEGNPCQANLWASHDIDTTTHEAFFSCDTDETNDSIIWWAIDGGWMGQIEDGHTYMFLDGTAVVGTNVDVQADWELTYDSSVRAAKTNIADWQADRAKFMQLRPTTYNAVEIPDGRPMVGLIAEEVEEALPYATTYLAAKGPDGDPDMDDLRLSGWNDKQMLVTLISVVQQQQTDIEALQARVAALEAKQDVG